MKAAIPTVAFLLLCGSASESRGQAGNPEHWIVTFRAPPSDSMARPVRIAWNGDSLRGEFSADGGQTLVGAAGPAGVIVELRNGERAVVQLRGKRESPGTMSGDWTGGSFRPGGAQAGTWSAVRTVASVAGRNAAERWILTRIPSTDRLAGASQPRSFHVDVAWHGDSLVGFPLGTAPLVGTVQSGRVSVLWPDADNRVLVLHGARSGRDSMSGSWASFAPPLRTGTWIAVRVDGSRSPRTIAYAPKRWYTTYSSANAPELHALPGDTVLMRGRSTGSGIVPAPIFVEGALPGDLLAVRILRIRPSPLTAYSQRSLVLDWFTTDFARAARAPAAAVWNWSLDTLAGVAHLDTTCAGCQGPAIRRLSNVTIPLAPMIGNIGVAPAWSEAFNAPDEGDYGGNLDYKWLREGATLYLPVKQPGALLSIASDMHAAQGDGELAGTGLEMDADVDILVDVVRGADVEGVRAEDATYRMAFGISADLSQALRAANTNLAEWLAKDFRLNQQELAFLLGSAAEIDIANVWGRESTVVAKIKKSLLAQIRP
jgi:acetamidase/formamidase